MITSNPVLFNIFKYLGIILFIISIILFCKIASNATKEKQISKEYLKGKNKFLIGSFLSLVVSIDLFTLSYYLNPITSEYFKNAEILAPNFLKILLIIFVAFVFSSVLYALMCSFTYYFFLESSQKNSKKALVVFLVNLLIFVGTLILYGEVNSPYLRYPLCNRIYIGTKGILLVTSYIGYNWAPAPSEGFGIQIAFYALCILGGAILALVIGNHKLKLKYGESGLLGNLFLIAFPSGIIGARAWYVIGNWERDGFNRDFMKIFRLSDGGLTIMGASLGIIAGLAFLIIMKYVKKKKPYARMNYLEVLDMLIPLILLAQFTGRWGNFFNNEVHGNLVNESSFMWLPSLIRNNMSFSSAHTSYSFEDAMLSLSNGKIYLPLFFIEGTINFLGFVFLEYFVAGFIRNRSINFLEKVKESGNKFKFFIASTLRFITCEGCTLGYYLVWYGLTRFFLEPLRDTSFNMGNDNEWSIKSAIIMAILGGAIIVIFGVWQTLRDHNKLSIKKY